MEKAWYALYTASRAEKQVKERLDTKGIENFLPLHTRMSKWSDRIKKIQEPLISCYIFIHIEKQKMAEALSTAGVLNVVKEEKTPVVIPDEQMRDFILYVENKPADVSFSTERIKIGQMIEIKKGPFMGLKGEMVDYQGSKHIVVRLKNIGCALVSISEENVEKLNI